MADVTTAAYVLLIEGIGVSFWTSESAAATVDVERDSYHVGLGHPRVSAGISLTDGWLTSATATFEIDDVDDSLADLFAARRPDVEPLTTTIDPNDTPAAAWRSKHVGIEYIGSAGERRVYPAFRDFLVGMRHPSDSEAASMGLGAVPVTAEPYLWPGRRAALYRVTQTDGTWQSWADSALIWWGVVRGTGSVRGRSWSISCDGHDALLRKHMGQAAWSDPVSVDDAEILFGANETTVHARFHMRQFGTDGALYEYGVDEQTIAGSTVDDVRDALSAAILAALDAEGDDGQFSGSDNTAAANEEPGGDAFVVPSSTAISIKITNAITTRTRIGYLSVTMSEKAWRALGYDPSAQGDEALLGGSDPETYVDFAVSTGVGGAPAGLPYWRALLSTMPVEALQESDIYSGDNGGDYRTWVPWYGNADDEVYTLYAGAGQEVYLASPTGETPYCRGQHDMPVAESTDTPGTAYQFAGGGLATDTRLFAFFGPRRAEGSEEEYTEYWVGRCSWRSASGAVGQENESQDSPALYISQWLDPQVFGFPPRNGGGATWQTDWSAPKGTISCVPLHHLTHTADGSADNPIKLCRNILLATGTGGGWYTDATYTSQQFGPGGKLEPGANNPSGLVGEYPADAEIEDLGLAIPSELVMSMQEATALYQSVASGLACKVAYRGRFPSEETLIGLTRPIGVCWSLRSGKYTMFDPAAPINPDVDHVITTEDYHAPRPTDGVQRQALALHPPVDSVTISYGRHPVEGDFLEEATLRATDAGARYRARDTTIAIDAHGYSSGLSFGAALVDRWRRMFDFWGRRHFVVQGVKLHLRADIWPGDTVRWTDPSLVSVDGEYGVSGALGYVVSRTHDCAAEVTTVDVVLVSESGDGYRMCAPCARVLSYDSGTPSLSCAADFRRVSTGGFLANDVALFAEPSWSSYGGDADITVLQYDGVTWTTAGHSTVASVDTAAHTIVLGSTLSGGTGYYRDRDSIVVMRAHADQSAAWVLALLAPVADDSGEVNGNAADAVQWGDI